VTNGSVGAMVVENGVTNGSVGAMVVAQSCWYGGSGVISRHAVVRTKAYYKQPITNSLVLAALLHIVNVNRTSFSISCVSPTITMQCSGPPISADIIC
jgi:hypothetical protein